jgi:hypothetical protein
MIATTTSNSISVKPLLPHFSTGALYRALSDRDPIREKRYNGFWFGLSSL